MTNVDEIHQRLSEEAVSNSTERKISQKKSNRHLGEPSDPYHMETSMFPSERVVNMFLATPPMFTPRANSVFEYRESTLGSRCCTEMMLM